MATNGATQNPGGFHPKGHGTEKFPICPKTGAVGGNKGSKKVPKEGRPFLMPNWGETFQKRGKPNLRGPKKPP